MAEKLTGNDIKIKSLRICKNKVILYLSNKEKLDISYDTYSQYYFYKGKILSKEEIENIKKYNDSLTYFNMALKILNTKMISENALKEKLIHKGASIFICNDIIMRLKNHDLINDKGLILDYIEYGKEKCYGKYKIINILYEKKFKKEDIEKIHFNKSDEINKIKKIIKLNESKYKNEDYLSKKNKIYSILINRGFEKDLINEILNTVLKKDDNNDLLIKNKIKKEINHYIKIHNNKFENNNELFNNMVKYLRRKRYNYNLTVSIWREEYGDFD